MEPVSIRTKNPGAMWPGSVSKRFGSTEWIPCAGDNKCAVFPTFEQGAAAQFYLWATKYSNMTLSAAIYKWSGHNSSDAYAKFLSARIPGLTMNDKITDAFLSGPRGLAFMKAQAQWEAGKPYPMTDEQWRKGQAIAFGAPVYVPPPPDIEPPIPAPGFWQELIAAIVSIFKQLFRRK